MRTYDKIKNYILNSTESFTVKKIENELTLTHFAVKQCIRKMNNKGFIKLIDIQKNAKVYILNKKSKSISGYMSNYDKIKTYIINTTESFTVNKIANELGLTTPVVRQYIQRIRTEGHCKLIGNDKSSPRYYSEKYKGNLLDDMSDFDKIKNYINNSYSPFTTDMIKRALGIPYIKLKRYLHILRLEGVFRYVYTEDHKRVYISNSFSGNIPPKRNTHNKLKNYIYNLNKPFTVKKIAYDVGLKYAIVSLYIQLMLKEGYIKQIGIDKNTKVYVINKYKGT